MIRCACWFGNVFGHFLLFLPTVQVLSWIPLVGALLAWLVAIAAFIFALIWGSLLHVVVMCVAWVAYRPVVGILGLCAVGAAVFVLFFVGGSSAAVGADGTDMGADPGA